MTMDINELIGPEPTPVPAPKFPTPWQAWGNGIYPRNGAAIAIVRGLRDLEHEEAAEIARFIVEAVNEKVARGQAVSEFVETMKDLHKDDTEYFKSRGHESFYRIRAGEEQADAYYGPDYIECSALSEGFVRRYKLAVSREDVPEAFRLYPEAGQ